MVMEFNEGRVLEGRGRKKLVERKTIFPGLSKLSAHPSEDSK